jgi:hypothetical protein
MNKQPPPMTRDREGISDGENQKTVAPALDPSESTYVVTVRWLIWIYFVLWLIEGALRKWFLPGLSNPLLVVRDPVVLLIYVVALVGNVMPVNRIVIGLFALGAVSAVAGFLVTGNLMITVYGFRSNFLHLPLVYVMAIALRPVDLRRIGFVLLICSIPMAILMAKQFRSGYDSWWNLGAGGGRQIISVGGKIRAAGTFSYISGPVAFYALVASFLISAVALRRWFRWWLLIASGAATILAASVAGSRGFLIVIAISFVFFLIGSARYPRILRRITLIAAGAFVSFLCVAFLDIYKEGKAVTTERATNATINEGGLQGVVNRAIEPLLITPEVLGRYKFFGQGLGTGTVAAGALARAGDAQPDWAENEWSRVLLESGPLFGLVYLALRAAMVLGAFIQSMQAAGRGNFLAIALFGAAGPMFLTGQFGQPTSQGGAVIGMGLCLAALSLTSKDTSLGDGEDAEEVNDIANALSVDAAPTEKIRRGRSAYAEMLHRK